MSGSLLSCEDADSGLPVSLIAYVFGIAGRVVGEVAAGLQRAAGVGLRCDVTVEALEGSGGRFRASLSDGTTVEVGLAVITLGALRNTEWLTRSGLGAGPLGVSCDPGGRAYASTGWRAMTCSRSATWPGSPGALFEYEFLGLEHWANALVGAQVAAHNMMCESPDRRANVSVPAFCSVQWGTNTKSVGVPALRADRPALGRIRCLPSQPGTGFADVVDPPQMSSR